MSSPNTDSSISTPKQSGAVSRYVPYTDALRVAGALAVIFIHVTGDGVSTIGTYPTRAWWLCLVMESFSRWAVPIFVMVSGLLLLNPSKKESPGEFYRKRLARLAIPVLAWSVFYLIWSWFYDGTRFTALGALYQLVSGGAYYHLWFLTMLMGLYLATPLLRIIVRELTQKQLWITTFVILALAMGDMVARAFNNTDFTFLFKFCPFIGLFLLGYCLSTVRLTPKMVPLGALALLAGASISIGATYLVTYHGGTQSWDVDNRLFLMEEEFSPGTLIMSVGIFLMFAAWYETNKIASASAITKAMSAASLGIYLAHPFILALLYTHDIDYEWHGVIIGSLTMVSIGFCGASLLSLILLRIPVLKRLV